MNALKRYHIPDDMQTMKSARVGKELGARAKTAPAYRAQVMARKSTEETR